MLGLGKTKRVELSKLIPTVDALGLHIQRVYLQVQFWLHRDGNIDNPDHELYPGKWGWKVENHTLTPIRMNQPPAPENILKVIFCRCKTDCGTMCGCRRSGLSCTLACKVCCGTDCSNIEVKVVDDNESDAEILLED